MLAVFPEGLCSRKEMDKAVEQQLSEKLNSISSNGITSEFVASNIKNFIENWKDTTSDSIILDIVENRLKIYFLSIPGNLKVPQILHCISEREISTEIKSLLTKGAVVEALRESGDFISTVFPRKKKSFTFRFILNLKHLNGFVMYKHFKVTPILDVFKIIKKVCGWPGWTLRMHFSQCL